MQMATRHCGLRAHLGAGQRTTRMVRSAAAVITTSSASARQETGHECPNRSWVHEPAQRSRCRSHACTSPVADALSAAPSPAKHAVWTALPDSMKECLTPPSHTQRAELCDDCACEDVREADIGSFAMTSGMSDCVLRGLWFQCRATHTHSRPSWTAKLATVAAPSSVADVLASAASRPLEQRQRARSSCGTAHHSLALTSSVGCHTEMQLPPTSGVVSSRRSSDVDTDSEAHEGIAADRTLIAWT